MARKGNRGRERNTLLRRFSRQKRRNLLAEPGPSRLVLILDGLKPNYNIGKIFRSAQAFGARKIHLAGIDVFDPAPGKGAFKHVPAVFDPDFATAHTALGREGYRFFYFHPRAGTPLDETPLPVRSAFIFGHEEFGFSFDPSPYPDLTPVHIRLVGNMDSLNVSVAASIAMYEYIRQHPPAA